ncbi:hypothetical protein EDD11_005912 [Mortierella claussenii]|nr:hypothetical protein EDD11_005912 [Mortierella claussenii]
MADQAEILRKRREARQKKILASGESRLSKITGTAGTSTQVAPSPAVLQAREQLLKKEQEEERLKTLKAAGVDITDPAMAQSSGLSWTPQMHGADELGEEDGEEEMVMPNSPSQRAAAHRIARQQQSSPSTHSYSTTSASTAATSSTFDATKSSAGAGAAAKPATAASATTVQDYDADPDDALGAPPSSAPFASSSSFGGHNPFLSSNNGFSAQQQQALTRMFQEESNATGNNSKIQQQQSQSNPFGNVPPGFTVLTPQVDETARWWKLLHFVLSVLLGLGVVYREYSRQGDLGRFETLAIEKPLPYGAYQVAPIPVFWYFITMELILQTTRMVLHGVTASPSSTLGTVAGFLPSPFSDAIRIFMRYRLIWSSMVNDLTVVVFIVGLTIAFSHMFS